MAPDFGPRPFCSWRCKQIDLGNWLSQKYVISEPLEDVEHEPREQEAPDREDDEASLN